MDACYFAREDDMYRSGHCTYVVQEGCALATDLEARHRPGHFRGVLTVVLKLLQRGEAAPGVVRPERLPAAAGGPAHGG
ncbi:MAG: hypothetical protein KatS3mg102_0056 [Planctomycetota bacterium]|nr:MAG: hypothetical protein KatS3mg102_0056 [Planctomycetota bacterium]